VQSSKRAPPKKIKKQKPELQEAEEHSGWQPKNLMMFQMYATDFYKRTTGDYANDDPEVV